MNSKEKIKNIKSVINEFYHKEKCEGRLTECANDCWESYQKVCDEIEQDLDRLKHLEKELKQTKLNFRNSQTHSKNCYKKLKEKYVELQHDYNDLQKDYDVLDEECLNLEKENKELKTSYESLKKDYWELDKVENDILQKFLLQGQVISAIQDEIINKIENETIYEDVSPMCEITIRINKKIFDMLFEKKEAFESVGGE